MKKIYKISAAILILGLILPIAYVFFIWDRVGALPEGFSVNRIGDMIEIVGPTQDLSIGPDVIGYIYKDSTLLAVTAAENNSKIESVCVLHIYKDGIIKAINSIKRVNNETPEILQSFAKLYPRINRRCDNF